MLQVATKKKKNIEWKNGYDEGRGDADRWITSCTLEDLWWMATGKMSVPSWEPCTPQSLNKGETAKYNREKSRYELGFRRIVCSELISKLAYVEFAFHFQGLKDGARWARDFATTKQLERLQFAYFNCGPYEASGKCFSCQAVEIKAVYSPAQDVVSFVHTPDDADMFVDYDLDSPEFREFWTPFVSEPIDHVIANLCSVTNTRGHKLRVPEYVEGFVDGALGLTQKVLGDVLLAS